MGRRCPLQNPILSSVLLIQHHRKPRVIRAVSALIDGLIHCYPTTVFVAKKDCCSILRRCFNRVPFAHLVLLCFAPGAICIHASRRFAVFAFSAGHCMGRSIYALGDHTSFHCEKRRAAAAPWYVCSSIDCNTSLACRPFKIISLISFSWNVCGNIHTL